MNAHGGEFSPLPYKAVKKKKKKKPTENIFLYYMKNSTHNSNLRFLRVHCMRLIINIDDLMTIAHLDDLIDNSASSPAKRNKIFNNGIPEVVEIFRTEGGIRAYGRCVCSRPTCCRAAVHMLHDRRGMCALSDRRLIEATRIYCSTSSRFCARRSIRRVGGYSKCSFAQEIRLNYSRLSVFC